MVGPIASVRPQSKGGLVRRKSLIGFRAACEAMWGKSGIEQICKELPDEVRERTAGLQPLPEWIPLEDLIAWHVAVWNGPAKLEEATMTRHARLTVDQGFGRVKRVVIAALSPHLLATRVAALWRDEYSTGQLETLAVEDNSVQLALYHHPYVDIPLMRYIIAEVYRYVLSMTRARNVSVTHAVRGSALIVTLRWD
jgi:hypothetical protein